MSVLVIRCSKFVNNSPGAVWISTQQTSLTITESAFIGNVDQRALSLNSDYDSNVSISSSIFTRNQANYSGPT